MWGFFTSASDTPFMTPQEQFDKAVRGLADQGERAVRPNGSCTYFDPETGRRCAVGLVVTPWQAVVLRAYEEQEDDAPPVCRAAADLDLPELAHNLMQRLQGVHDEPEHWTDDGMSELGVRELRNAVEDYMLPDSCTDVINECFGDKGLVLR